MTRYTREEYGQSDSDQKNESMSVSFTIQWLTGKIEEITYDPRLGWYHLKQKIMKRNFKIGSPNQIHFVEKKGEQWIKCNLSGSCSIKQGDHYYVVIEDISI